MFNHKLFKKFTFNNKNYEPYVSKNFKMIIDNFTLEDDIDYVTLEDDKGNRIEILAKDLFKTILFYGLKIQDNIIYGRLIINSDKKLCIEDTYKKWLQQSNLNGFNEILKKNLEEGYIYEFEDGSHFIFLGKRYVSSWNIDKKSNEIKTTKVSMKYIGLNLHNHMFENSKSVVDKVIQADSFFLNNKKIVKKMRLIDFNIENVLEMFYIRNNIFFSTKEKPHKNTINYKLKEISEDELANLCNRLPDSTFIQMFHKSRYNVFMLNRVLIGKEFIENNALITQRLLVRNYDLKWIREDKDKLYIGNNSDYNFGDNTFSGLDYNNSELRQVPRTYYLLEGI